jgi:DNA (cytosine-5)-methyltransferase 1
MGRAAPWPTETGIHGQPRLAARFTEWLMGLPENYVTGLGLPRSAELKALGNGVVPQQAEAAIRWLVEQLARDAQDPRTGRPELPG